MKSNETILTELTSIFQTIFKKEDIVVSYETTSDDINGWDSLTHMHLIDAVEHYFKCEFSFNDVMNFRNVGDMVKTISKKLS